MIARAEIIETNEITVSPQVAEFYGIELSDDNVLQMAEIMEGACPGLGDWFLNLDPDGEFQRDLIAAGKLFWQKRGGCKRVSPESRSSKRAKKPVDSGARVTTTLRLHRESLGLDVAEFAARVGIHQVTLRRLEMGAFKHAYRIHSKTRRRLEALCRKSIEELLRPLIREHNAQDK